MESKTRTCKIYETENFSKLVVGIQVAACMISDAPPIVDEASIVRRAGDLTGEGNTGLGNTCSSCGAGPFETRAQQTAHYKHHWHAHNLRRRLLGRPPLTLLEFNSKEDDTSSVSDSDSDTEDTPNKGSEVSELFLAATRHCRAYFTNKDGQVLSVYRCLLHHKKEWIGGDGRGERWVEACHKLKDAGGWALFMCAGGHFAGAIFRGDAGVAIKHKSLHSYVTRRGQGKAQITRDNRGNAPRSAGASLRRYNQEQFAMHVQEVLTGWKEELATCTLLLYRAVGPLNKAAVFGSGSPISKNDTRLRSFPFPTRRPSFKEVQRAHSILASMEVYDSVEVFQTALTSLNTVSLSNSNTNNSDGRRPRKMSPMKLDRAKSRELTARPLPSDLPTLKEDETPCYIDGTSPPNWTQTLSDFNDSKRKKSSTAINKQVDAVTDKLQKLDMRETLQEFDDSLKKKGKKSKGKSQNHPPNNKNNTQDSSESIVKEKGQEKDVSKLAEKSQEEKPKGGKSKRIATEKTPQNIEKMWEAFISGSRALIPLLDRWEGPPSLEESLNFPDPVDGNTILHKAAIAEQPELISQLLGFGADPCCRNLKLQTPYCATSDQETRIAFRLFQGLQPDKYQYAKADIPGPLTLEILEQEKEKKATQKKAKRQKEKEKLQEKVKTNKFLELNDVQKMTVVTEKRCFSCGSVVGSKPFNYEQYNFCTIKCLQNHRNARPLNLSA